MFRNIAMSKPEILRSVSGKVCIKGSYFLDLGFHIVRPNQFVINKFFKEMAKEVDYLILKSRIGFLNVNLFMDDEVDNFYFSGYEKKEDLPEIKKDPKKLYDSGLLTTRSISGFEFVVNEEDERIEGVILEIKEDQSRMEKYINYKFSNSDGKNNLFLRFQKKDKEKAYKTFVEIVNVATDGLHSYSVENNLMY